MRKPIILKIILGGYDDECPKCDMPEDECECGEMESGDEEDYEEED